MASTLKWARARGRVLLLATGLSVLLSTAAPIRAQAGIGVLVTASPTLVVSPVFIPMYYLAAIAGGAAAIDRLKAAQHDHRLWNLTQALFMASFGVLMLDGSNAQGMDFGPMDPVVARGIGLSEAEYQAYQSELPMLNALREEALIRTDAVFSASGCTSCSISGQKPELGKIAQVLRFQWRELSREAVSPQAATAMEKLALKSVSGGSNE